MYRLTAEQHTEIISRYTSGELASPLAREFGMHPAAVGKLLEREGIEKHSRTYTNRLGHTVNERAFDSLTDDTAYWVGLLMADGNVHKNMVSLRLKESDIRHIEKFRTFMGGSQKITAHSSTSGGKTFVKHGYQFNSPTVVARLAELGITERKSFTATPPPELLDNRHFWRGMIDGNGSLGIYPSPRSRTKEIVNLELVGSRNVVDAFCAFASKYLDRPVNTHSYKSIFKMSLGGRPAARLVALLYDDASTALDRKAAKAGEIKDWYKAQPPERTSKCTRQKN